MKFTNFVLILLILAIAVAIFFYSKNSNKQYSVTTPIASSVIDGYKLSKDQMVKCIRTDKNMKPGAVYMHNDMLYFEGGHPALATTAEAAGIIKDKTMWVWDPKTKNGSRESLNGSNFMPDMAVSGFENYLYSCEYSDSTDDIFNPPSNIKFSE